MIDEPVAMPGNPMIALMLAVFTVSLGYGILLPLLPALVARLLPLESTSSQISQHTGLLTAVYALQSPGGWHLIGRTPAPLWDLQRDPPAILAAGDQVRFEPISLGDYEALARRSAGGELRLQPEERLAAAGAAA